MLSLDVNLGKKRKRRRLRRWRRFALTIGLLALSSSGCILQDSQRYQRYCPPPISLEPSCGPAQLKPSEPDLCCPPPGIGPSSSPLDLDESAISDERVRGMTLEECTSFALANSKIMRDLGGSVVRNPQAVGTVYDPSITYSDPRFGEEAALSAFDANLFSSAYFEKNDRRVNNLFFGNQGIVQQDLQNYTLGANKRTATGGLVSIKQLITYDHNNQLSNGVGPTSFDNIIEGEMRHPLLQGAGTEYNRIAGPGAVPGQINGVLIARVRTDISLADFERSVRDLVAETENAYWDLYYAYRDLEARILVRDIAAETYEKLQAAKGAVSAGDLAQAREQVLRFQSEIVDSLYGRPIDGTRSNNGSTGGTFRGSGGVRICERRLRLIIGMSINDGQLLRPADSPAPAPLVYDWQESLALSLQLRPELRRQRWLVKQRELELIAHRNFLKPQLDLISRYRMRGFGEHLLGNSKSTDATRNLLDGDFQEWQLGVEYSLPVGFRKAHAAMRNSQLAHTREAEVLREQERAVEVGLSNAMSEMRRSFDTMDLHQQRLEAIVQQLSALEARRLEGNNPALDVLLETHRRLLDARLRFHQSQVEYALALRNVHVERGTLLQQRHISLSEAMSDAEAYRDAQDKQPLLGTFDAGYVDPSISSTVRSPLPAN